MKDRIFGIETEYGCLPPETDPHLSPDFISLKTKDGLFFRDGLGLVDMHYRGRDEPPGNGGFLFNGGRLYIDMGHVEYATPECQGLFDLVAADRAGEVMVQRALDHLDKSGESSFIKNNIDHYTGATFGCHENYLVRREVPFSQVLLPAMLPFFVTRQIFAGAGRVGGHTDIFETGAPAGESITYQISQRADHIVTEIYQWIQFSRAIINTRDEPLADWEQFRRLHLLVGDSNMSEYATALKVGTTGLVLQLLEEGVVPEMGLLNAVDAIRDISRDLSCAWEIQREDGRYTTAVEVQRHYLELSEQHLRGRDEESDWVLNEWRFVLDGLVHAPESL
ncbi:MAG: proteasome accessory factor PafA2 family protein, partial [Candidatus Latescibacterota bacterium]